MKKWLIYRLLALWTLVMLSGCVIVINQPSPQERELIKIQETVGEQVRYVSQKVASGNYEKSDMETFISRAEQTIRDALRKIDELNLPEKARIAGEETKKYLQSAQKIFEEIKKLITDIEQLKTKGAELSEQAQKVIQEQIDNSQKTIEAFSAQLNQLIQKMDDVRKQILGPASGPT